jgi:hypothetical protein
MVAFFCEPSYEGGIGGLWSEAGTGKNPIKKITKVEKGWRYGSNDRN